MRKHNFLKGDIVSIDILGLTNCEIISHLGSGGFADVWKVRNNDTSREYVLKHIHVKRTGKLKDKLIQRIYAEGNLKIRSEYVVKYLGVCEFKENNFAILMPYYSGMTLDEWIRKNKGIKWKDKKGIFLKILKGVKDIHSNNVYHRDLKSQNIYIKDNNDPFIFDFGHSKHIDLGITTKAGDKVMSFAYSAPENFMDKLEVADPRVDIYSLGVILYEMIVGMNHFEANEIQLTDFIGFIMSDKENIVDIDEGNLPKEKNSKIVDVIVKSTMFDKDKRYLSVDEMMNAINEGVEILKRFVANSSEYSFRRFDYKGHDFEYINRNGD